MISFIGFAGLAHELSHSSVFSSKALNKIFYFLACALVVENHEFFTRNHAYHHKNTFSENDHEAAGSDEWSKNDFLRYVLIDYRSFVRKYYYTVVNSLGLDGKNLNSIQNTYKKAALKIVIINIFCSHYIIYFFSKYL